MPAPACIPPAHPQEAASPAAHSGLSCSLHKAALMACRGPSRQDLPQGMPITQPAALQYLLYCVDLFSAVGLLSGSLFVLL